MSTAEELRAAAQAALECLENLQGGCTDSGDGTVEAITVWCPEVIDALRAALALPATEGSWAAGYKHGFFLGQNSAPCVAQLPAVSDAVEAGGMEPGDVLMLAPPPSLTNEQVHHAARAYNLALSSLCGLPAAASAFRRALDEAAPDARLAPAATVSQAAMVRLSKALGNPTEVEADPGETVEDALIRMASKKLAQPAASGEPLPAPMPPAPERCRSTTPEKRRPDDHCPDQWCGLLGQCRIGYTAQPAPALVPLTDQQLCSMRKENLADDDAPAWAYEKGVRDAENAHGINLAQGEPK